MACSDVTGTYRDSVSRWNHQFPCIEEGYGRDDNDEGAMDCYLPLFDNNNIMIIFNSP